MRVGATSASSPRPSERAVAAAARRERALAACHGEAPQGHSVSPLGKKQNPSQPRAFGHRSDHARQECALAACQDVCGPCEGRRADGSGAQVSLEPSAEAGGHAASTRKGRALARAQEFPDVAAQEFRSSRSHTGVRSACRDDHGAATEFLRAEASGSHVSTDPPAEAGRQAIRAPTAECARDARPEDLRCRRKRACAIQSRHQENEFQSRTRTTLPCAGNIADLTPIFRRAWKWSCSSSWTPGHSTSTGPPPPSGTAGSRTSSSASFAPSPRAHTPSDPARLPNRTQGNLSTTSRSSAPEAAGIRRLSSSWCSSNDEPGRLPSLCASRPG